LSEIVVGIVAALLGWVIAVGAGAGAALATLVGLAAGVGAGVYLWVVLSSTNLTTRWSRRVANLRKDQRSSRQLVS
jgi:hypothetical protein